MDDPMFGIEDMEAVVGTVAILSTRKLVVESKYVVLKMPFKFLHV